jgi:hypothetical protein
MKNSIDPFRAIGTHAGHDHSHGPFVKEFGDGLHHKVNRP